MKVPALPGLPAASWMRMKEVLGMALPVVCLAVGITLPLADAARRDLGEQSGAAGSEFLPAFANDCGGGCHLVDFGAAYSQASVPMLVGQATPRGEQNAIKIADRALPIKPDW
jgi:hypothetical protein